MIDFKERKLDIVKDINKLKSDNDMITIYRELSKKYKLRPSTIKNIYYGANK